MARVTVEDCIVKVPNRFDLVMMSAQRAREVSAGAPMTLDRDNDKNPVVALREIAAESVELDALKESLVRGLQRHSSIEEEEAEDVIELMAGEQELANVDRGEPVADYEGEAGDEPAVNYADADEVSEDDPGDDPLAQADDVAEDALAPDDMAEPGGDDLT